MTKTLDIPTVELSGGVAIPQFGVGVFQVKPEDTIELSDKAKNFVYVREAIELSPDPPPYLYRNVDQLQGTMSRLPERDEIPLPVPIEERLIIEFYS